MNINTTLFYKRIKETVKVSKPIKRKYRERKILKDRKQQIK